MKHLDTHEKENILLEHMMESFEEFVKEKEKNIGNEKQESWDEEWRNG